ncbi:MAG: Rne/Rng family ribonuclease, partial [Rhodoferax sp.]|nr:Rne/Rng family ribonuclease [Actinomycetota bacterium]
RAAPPRRGGAGPAAVGGRPGREARKQRRRDGREAGRRKPTITESEFLARRESVQRAMVVRESAGRTQIAVLEDGVLVEHYVANETNASMIGNVYLGRVQNVLPSMEAAFVDIGKGRNAVLYAGEVNWDAAGLDGQPRRIETALKSGDTVLVQVTKDPMGHKGARLTSQVSLPGRYLVYVPNSSMTGISRKLPDTERSRLKRILKAVVPEKAGVIVRTAAEGASEDELGQDVERLTAQWAEIDKKAASSSGGAAPKLLYGEPDLTIRVVRDVFNEDFTSLVVSGEGAWGVVQPYLRNVAPDLADRVTRWTSDADVFAEHRIDEQLLKAMDRKVWLPSGGSLVIDRTEAMTVVDVNTGKFTGSGGNLEETVTRNNLEAAEEVVRQLRLRDIGGIIVVDFIDMVLEGNRDLVLRRLLECLGRDRTKHQVAEVTSLGLVQMTRKRVGQGLLEVFSEPCEHCQGRGVVIHAEPVDRRSGDSGSGGQAPAESGGQGRSEGGSSRRGRGGRGSEPAAPPEPAPVRQPIPAGFMASLVHHDTPASPTGVEQPSSIEPADEPVEQPAVAVVEPDVQPQVQLDIQPDVQPDVEPDVEPARPARRRRRASAPSGPPIVHD